jgi:hypothetical protein
MLAWASGPHLGPGAAPPQLSKLEDGRPVCDGQ